jgi:N-acetylmuramoyl-L-alanine amidase
MWFYFAIFLLNIIFVCCLWFCAAVNADFKKDVYAKTGITLKDLEKNQYQFVPFEEKWAHRNHYFMRPEGQKVTTIILHDTVGNLFSTLNKFSDGKEHPLNAHYIVTQKDGLVPGGLVIEMVPPPLMAQHAWPSWFRGKDNANDYAIGIELVGKGFVDQGRKRYFYAYDPMQIKALAVLLARLVKEYAIRPENILSHADVSPQRKYDVTIAFPWRGLYEKYGLGMGLDGDERTPEQIMEKFPVPYALPQKFNETFFQNMLTLLGYDTRFADDHDASAGEKRAKWANVYQAFFAHYSRNGQGALWRGKPDQRDQFWAFALGAKYFGKDFEKASKTENGSVDP